MNNEGKEPHFYMIRIRVELEALINQLRIDSRKVNEPRAQALFETSAEVLSGVAAACRHYEQKKDFFGSQPGFEEDEDEILLPREGAND